MTTRSPVAWPAGHALGLTDQVEHALGVAYRYLNQRDRTVKEVRRHLEQKRIDAPAIDATLQSLSNQSCLDDARFARVFAQDKRELEQWGNDRIDRTLRARGIDDELIEAALGDRGSETELDRALGLLRRRFPSPSENGRERERALGLLLRKGYDAELAVDALRIHARGDTER